MAVTQTSVVAGVPFTAVFEDPGGLSALGARVEVPVTRQIVSAWRPAVLFGGQWQVVLDAPLSPGLYLLVWRTGDPEPPSFETVIPLDVGVASVDPVSTFPLVNVDLVRPTVEDVAELERTRTIAAGGGELITFDMNTRPSSADVEGLIDQAVDLVLAELPLRYPDTHYAATRRAVALYAAVLIEGSHFREQVDEGAASLWRTMYTNAIIGLKSKIDRDLQQARLLGRFEPRVIA